MRRAWSLEEGGGDSLSAREVSRGLGHSCRPQPCKSHGDVSHITHPPPSKLLPSPVTAALQSLSGQCGESVIFRCVYFNGRFRCR